MVSETQIAVIVLVIGIIGGMSLGLIYSPLLNISRASTSTQTKTETVTAAVTSIQTTSIFVTAPASITTITQSAPASVTTITESIEISPSFSSTQNVTVSGPVTSQFGTPFRVVFQSDTTEVQFSFPVVQGSVTARIPNHDTYLVQVYYTDPYGNSESCTAAFSLSVDSTSPIMSDDISC